MEYRKLSVTFANDGVVKTVAGEFVPRKIQDPKSAYAATLHMVLKHTADVFLTIVDVMAEKYGHSAEEMAETILAHPKFTEMYANPMIHDLGYFESKPPACASASAEAEAEAKAEAKREAAKAKLKAKRAAKDISGSASLEVGVEELTASMHAVSLEPASASASAATDQTPQEPKKMVTVKRIKKKETPA